MHHLTKSQRRAMIACECRVLPASIVDWLLERYDVSSFRELTDERAEAFASEVLKMPLEHCPQARYDRRFR